MMAPARGVVAPSVDDDWFRAAYARHRDPVWRYFVRRVGDDALADDLTSEVFLVAWRRRGDAPVGELPWLYGVARRVLSDDRRAARRRAARDSALFAAAAGAPIHDSPPEVATAAAGALALLSDDDRELLMLAAWDGLEPAELAAVLGCRPATARVRLHRARRRFAAHLNRLDEGATR